VALAGLCLASGRAAPAPAAPENYAAIFGDQYAGAERFLREHAWIAESLKLPPTDTRVALAVVFPELIRFSALQDSIEVRGLKVLYVQYGREYMNFSVGRFQMKPSFAERLEADYNRLFGAAERRAIGLPPFEMGDTPALREQRVLRLDDLAWQVRYLRLFMDAMAVRYGKTAFSGVEDRLRFYATAYNAGYTSGEASLRQLMTRRWFHTSLLPPKTTYNYADVAWFFFARGNTATSSPRGHGIDSGGLRRGLTAQAPVPSGVS